MRQEIEALVARRDSGLNVPHHRLARRGRCRTRLVAVRRSGRAQPVGRAARGHHGSNGHRPAGDRAVPRGHSRTREARRHRYGCLPASDVDALAGAMRHCFEVTATEAARMGSEARRQVWAKHHIDFEAAKLVKLMANVGCDSN